MKEWQVKIGRVQLIDNDIELWEVYVSGPKDSPYEGQEFKARFDFRGDYPICPPKVNFLMKVFHPGVN